MKEEEIEIIMGIIEGNKKKLEGNCESIEMMEKGLEIERSMIEKKRYGLEIKKRRKLKEIK